MRRFAAPVTIVLIALAVLAGVGVLMLDAWTGIGETDISLNGMLALGLGAVVTIALGVGLMYLVFYSSRRGHDH